MSDDKYLDDDSASAKKKNGPKAGAKAKPVAARTDSSSVEDVDAGEQTISLFLAVGLIVSALVVGLVVGYVVAPKGASNDLGAPATAGQAPALTPEQLKDSQLPASHPPVPGMSGDSTQAAPEGQAPESSEKSEEKAPKSDN